MLPWGDIQIAIEASSRVKNEENQVDIYALYISSFFNNNVFSDEISGWTDLLKSRESF
jgi:hypothetical protein